MQIIKYSKNPNNRHENIKKKKKIKPLGRRSVGINGGKAIEEEVSAT